MDMQKALVSSKKNTIELKTRIKNLEFEIKSKDKTIRKFEE